MIELEQDKQEIRKACLEVMRNKKAKFSERLQAATLLAGIQGLYGPGRPRVLGRAEDSKANTVELNNREVANRTAKQRLEELMDRINSDDE